MPLDDIFGFGKVLPIEKLIDILSKSVGRISKPYFDKKDVDTKAYEIEKLAEARAKEMKIIANAVNENFQITGGIDYKEEKISICSPKELPTEDKQPIQLYPPIQERTQERINFQELKKQVNIENVTAFAAEELKNEPLVTDEPLDEDWTTRFFRIAEDISNEDMQALWGKILAGEVKQPKTYSLRTLDLIRNLSKFEADIFMKVANFAIKSGNGNYIFKGQQDNKLSSDFNIHYADIALLKEIGLIQPGDLTDRRFMQNTEDVQRIFTTGNIAIFMNVKANTPTIKTPVEVFSTSGNELLKLIKPTPNIDYLKYFVNSLKNENVEMKYAYILTWEGAQFRYSLPLQDF
jgi:uncharacterized repeat protein (TIGR03899 family)